MNKDFRDMSIAEALAWGLAPGMVEHPISLHERNARRARWERRKAVKGRRK